MKFDVPPQIINGRTMIPLRAVTEALGAEVTWKPSTKLYSGAFSYYFTEYPDILIEYVIPYNNDLRIIQLNIGDSKVKTGVFWSLGAYEETFETLYLDSPPVIIDGRTLLPIRPIAELMGYTVEWDDSTKTAIIY